jgi:hypothetical protein
MRYCIVFSYFVDITNILKLDKLFFKIIIYKSIQNSYDHKLCHVYIIIMYPTRVN